jgi:hypothetical protein
VQAVVATPPGVNPDAQPLTAVTSPVSIEAPPPLAVNQRD